MTDGLAEKFGRANFERSERYTWYKFVASIDDYLDGFASEQGLSANRNPQVSRQAGQ